MSVITNVGLAVVLSISTFFIGHHVGVKSVPRALVYNQATEKWVPLPLKIDTKLAVASPLGIEPGVAYSIHTMDKEGMVAIILPPSLIPSDTPDQPAQPTQPKNQSTGGERMDHTTLLSARQ